MKLRLRCLSESCGVGVFFLAFFGKTMLTLLRSETVVLLLAFLTMEGHVYWNGALSIKECAYQ